MSDDARSAAVERASFVAEAGPAALGDRGGGRDGLATLALCIAFAAWADSSRLHAFLDADSLLPVFVSLQRWTLFYWGQNRFGMLLPLVARPLTDPLANLALQSGLSLFALAAALALLVRLVAPLPLRLPAFALLLATLVAVEGAPGLASLQGQPYPLEMALGLAGILLVEQGRRRATRALGVATLASAAWVSLALPLWAAPLVGLRLLVPAADAPPRRRTAEALAAVVAASLGGLLLSRFSAVHGTDYAPAPVATWLAGLAALTVRLAPRLAVPGLAAAILVPLLLVAVPPRAERAHGWLARAIGVLVATAALDLAALAASAWVRANGYRERYVFPALVLLSLAAVLAVCAAAARYLSARALLAAAVAPLVAALAIELGPPSPHAVRAATAPYLRRAAVVERLRCTHLLGGYWQTWPVAFAVVARRGDALHPPPPWVLSYRGEATESLWRPADWRTARVCALPGPAEPGLRASLPGLVTVASVDGIELRVVPAKTTVASPSGPENATGVPVFGPGLE